MALSAYQLELGRFIFPNNAVRSAKAAVTDYRVRCRRVSNTVRLQDVVAKFDSSPSNVSSQQNVCCTKS